MAHDGVCVYVVRAMMFYGCVCSDGVNMFYMCLLTAAAVGAPVARGAHTGAVLWGAGASVVTGAAVSTVGPPAALLTHTVTPDTCTTHTHAKTHR